MIERRGSGLLLHITSLHSPFGIGDLGPAAYKFVDFLSESKQYAWQILPINPIETRNFNNPYRSHSVFAGNTLLISPELLIQDHLLSQKEIGTLPSFPPGRTDYGSVASCKDRIFDTVYENFKRNIEIYRNEYEKFCSENSSWLDDYALFVALKGRFQGEPWSGWDRNIRDRDPGTLGVLKKELREAIEREKCLQFIFISQWSRLRSYCNSKGIKIIGDVSIYVSYESVDLWTHPEIFKLDGEKRPEYVSGVPPDYFSETGQLWGEPVYRWDVLKESGYSWWLKRMEHSLKLFDLVRLDHFRGFVAYWEVPAGEKNAVNGKWVKGPGEDFFGALLGKFPSLPIIAEDLGIITQDVRDVLSRFKFPGMNVIQFAFDDTFPESPYLPHRNAENSVVYTGTHDNNTVRGWFEKEATSKIRERIFQYVGREVPAEEIHQEFIRLAMSSGARLAIIPVQDVLGLGGEARMNLPAASEGNWQWQLQSDQLTPSAAKLLLEMTETYKRA